MAIGDAVIFGIVGEAVEEFIEGGQSQGQGNGGDTAADLVGDSPGAQRRQIARIEDVKVELATGPPFIRHDTVEVSSATEWTDIVSFEAGAAGALLDEMSASGPDGALVRFISGGVEQPRGGIDANISPSIQFAQGAELDDGDEVIVQAKSDTGGSFDVAGLVYGRRLR